MTPLSAWLVLFQVLMVADLHVKVQVKAVIRSNSYRNRAQNVMNAIVTSPVCYAGANATLTYFTDGLVCWHCISDNCDLNPKENFRAEQKSCLEGQICQKVFFKMQSDVDDTTYKSTVRSCADECTPLDDFNNCTAELYTTRGCVRKVCCNDDDLCNSGMVVHVTCWTIWFSSFILLTISDTLTILFS